jgi:hypothetical protein
MRTAAPVRAVARATHDASAVVVGANGAVMR